MSKVIQFPGKTTAETIEVLPWVVRKDQYGNYFPVRPLTDEERESYWEQVEVDLEATKDEELDIDFEPEED